MPDGVRVHAVAMEGVFIPTFLFSYNFSNKIELNGPYCTSIGPTVLQWALLYFKGTSKINLGNFSLLQ